jgi:maleate cis-trans isomerase
MIDPISRACALIGSRGTQADQFMLTASASLEDDLGKPVVSSSMGQIWWPLKDLGIKAEFKGYGKLLGTLA